LNPSQGITSTTVGPAKGRFVSLLRGLPFSEYFVLLLTLALFLSLAPFAPGLASGSNILNTASYLLPLFVAAVGMTVVMITGGIDLSITSIIALASVTGAKVMTTHGDALHTVLGIFIMLSLGVALGALNGAMVALLRLPAFMVTLASMMFLSGFAIWSTQSKNIYDLPASFLALGKELPIALSIVMVLALGAHLFLRRTVYGHWLYAVGQNSMAARISGVPVAGVVIGAYMASGFCAALASVILTGRLETGSPVLGREILLDIVGATVVGGTSLFGGRGKIAWTLFGVLFLALLDNALNLLNLSQFAITIAKGLVILLAAVLDSARQRFSRGAL